MPAAQARLQKRPKGRTLAEFLNKQNELLPAEQKLLDACAKGERAKIGSTRPKKEPHTKDSGQEGLANEELQKRTIRADFLRFLVLGGDSDAPVHEKGAHVVGAWIDGDLDLDTCHAAAPFTLDDCHIDGSLEISDADLPGLYLTRCVAKQINGDRLCCSGSLHLNDSVIDGATHLGGAHITGDLDCSGASLGRTADDAFSLYCEAAEISGTVFIDSENGSQPFHALGKTQFDGALLRGGVNFVAGTFEDDVSFLGATISGDLDLSESNFVSSGSAVHELILTRAEISGRLLFIKLNGRLASISLRGVNTNALVDDEQSWKVADELILDGFRYKRFIDTEISSTKETLRHVSPIDAEMRIRWLCRQRKQDLGANFKPQPWEQLIVVLREMGHFEQSRLVSIELQVQLRRAGKIAGVRKIWHIAYGLLYGYGYRPTRLIFWVSGALIFFAATYWWAAEQGIMAPTDRSVLSDPRYDMCYRQYPFNWTKCELIKRTYTVFNPVVYSLDLIIPILGLQQAKDWAPQVTRPCAETGFSGICVSPEDSATVMGYSPFGILISIFARLENLFGWLAGLMLVAVASGFVKRE